MSADRFCDECDVSLDLHSGEGSTRTPHPAEPRPLFRDQQPGVGDFLHDREPLSIEVRSTGAGRRPAREVQAEVRALRAEVERLTVERDAAQEHVAYHLRDYRLHGDQATGDLAVDMSAYAGRLKIRAEAAEQTVASLRAEVKRLRRAFAEQELYVESLCAPRVGFEKFKPGEPGYSADRQNWNIGDHVAESLVLALANAYDAALAQVARVEADALRRAADEIERGDPEWDSALCIDGTYHPVPDWLRERAALANTTPPEEHAPDLSDGVADADGKALPAGLCYACQRPGDVHTTPPTQAFPQDDAEEVG